MIVILNQEHLYLENKDVPCTLSLSFRIRERSSHYPKQLDCTVHMRSSDAIFGYGNDIPFFSLVQEFVLVYLNQGLGEKYEMGTLTVFSESLHVYEKHFGMLEKLIQESTTPVHCPRITEAVEISYLRADHRDKIDQYEFSKWLNARDPKLEKVAS